MLSSQNVSLREGSVKPALMPAHLLLKEASLREPTLHRRSWVGFIDRILYSIHLLPEDGVDGFTELLSNAGVGMNTKPHAPLDLARPLCGRGAEGLGEAVGALILPWEDVGLQGRRLEWYSLTLPCALRAPLATRGGVGEPPPGLRFSFYTRHLSYDPPPVRLGRVCVRV